VERISKQQLYTECYDCLIDYFMVESSDFFY